MFCTDQKLHFWSWTCESGIGRANLELDVRGWTCESGIGRANLELDVRGWACESGIGRANPKELQASLKVLFGNP